MVEIFCKRSELMPPDESIDQHKKKRAEEIAEVDKDKASPEGLFKGTFHARPLAELLYDEADGVLRCPYCHHEHEGGLECTICGTRFEESYNDEEDQYGFSDVDDDADLDLELEDLEADVDGDHHGSHFPNFFGIPHFPFSGAAHRFHHMHHRHDEESLGESSSPGSDIDRYNDEDDEDEGSLHAFVVGDEEPIESGGAMNQRQNRQPITISDDESDGPVAPRRRHLTSRRGAASNPSVLIVTDSENGETNSEAVMLRDAGWSSLDTENDSEGEEPVQYDTRGYALAEEQYSDDEDESDTNTMRNEASDDEDDQDGEDTYPPYQYNGETYLRETPSSYTSDDDAGHLEAESQHSMDGDGDTEMSASPGPSTSSRAGSVSIGWYGGYDRGEIYGDESEEYGDEEGTPRANRGSCVGTDGYGNLGEHLGTASEIHEFEGDSSEASIQPPTRRRPRQRMGNPRIQQTDPRISMMFAQHQQSLRGVHNQQQELDEFVVEVGRAEPASRNRRMAAYRLQPVRRVDPLRSSRPPSATRIISSSNRVARPPRQYQRRYH